MNLYQVFVTFLSYNNCERCFPTNNPSQITVKVKFNTLLQYLKCTMELQPPEKLFQLMM